ncbi:hypothetical protein HK096_007150, partial [Nowakowskiella sp. JEL0078]
KKGMLNRRMFQVKALQGLMLSTDLVAIICSLLTILLSHIHAYKEAYILVSRQAIGLHIFLSWCLIQVAEEQSVFILYRELRKLNVLHLESSCVIASKQT